MERSCMTLVGIEVLLSTSHWWPFLVIFFFQKKTFENFSVISRDIRQRVVCFETMETWKWYSLKPVFIYGVNYQTSTLPTLRQSKQFIYGERPAIYGKKTYKSGLGRTIFNILTFDSFRDTSLSWRKTEKKKMVSFLFFVTVRKKRIEFHASSTSKCLTRKSTALKRI